MLAPVAHISLVPEVAFSTTKAKTIFQPAVSPTAEGLLVMPGRIKIRMRRVWV